jgi:acyl carrier protein
MKSTSREVIMSKFKAAWHNFKPMVADYLAIEVSIISALSTWEELGVDSLDFVELIMYIEEEFNVEFTNQEVEDIKTIGGLHILLIRTLEGKRECEITTRDTTHDRSSQTQYPEHCKHCGRR